MRVYFDGLLQLAECGKSAIACNCCGKMWSSDDFHGKGKNAAAERSEKVASKNGWLTYAEKNVHICDECSEKMVDRSYGNYRKSI